MEEFSPEAETKIEGPPPPPMSLAARLVNVVAIPGEVFEDIKQSAPSVGNWLVPLLLFIAVSWVSAWLIYSQAPVQQRLRQTNEQLLQKLVAKGVISKDQVAANRQFNEFSTRLSPYTSPVVLAVVTPFGWGLLLWLLGNKVFKARFSFMKAVEVSGLANMIAVLGEIATLLLLSGLGSWITSSPGLQSFDPENPPQALMMVATVVTFWLLAVRAAGLARLSGAPFIRAAGWIFGLWSLWTCLLLTLGLGLHGLLS